MKKRLILIVTDEIDRDADIILLLLREMGQEVVRVHTSDFPLQIALSSSYDGTDWSRTIATRKRTIQLDEVRSIWWRRPGPPTLPSELTDYERGFVRDEVREGLTGLWESIEHECFWVSFPAAIKKAEHKMSQLSLATRLGLQVPQTLVSNDPDRVRSFYERCHQEMIYKTLYSTVPNPQFYVSAQGMSEQIRSGFPKAQFVYTTRIGEEQLALLETIRTAPGIFQEYIPKQVELRATVIGDELFTAELHSQLHEETRTDFRHYEVETPILPHTLPAEIAEQCLALTRASGLNYSTSDFILTPDGRYVFLEMNPNGQSFWVQDHVPELKLKEALAACLIRGSNS
jgi:glutathione synthase/RimK-type ligase-like ATP-grasp enzyme